ncbi:MSF1-domain-containing protein [Basidiobolus meristosporus CBS 931.73]|uniref:MSF1-domain-containing protein n=1 Tax=Basidiobolus meristosporus CBS 931.73 TaxID=1314790 RepID=A0A1Y1XFY1_9FUNG|nr:MSF1-domain-containing protein [Basidiobolus meristosporus CBS 931.73]|eukprot:ORX84623.1 MSF1-domain-containing protein [Basidiobolus meristosporus CBS 931.73]
MKFFETSHTFEHSWAQVSSGWWRKYPNENAPHILHVDIIGVEVDPATGILSTERLVAAKQSTPTIMRKLLGGDQISYAHETIEVDPKTKTFTVTTKNMTYSNILAVEEKVVYRPKLTDPTKTSFVQTAQFSALGALSRVSGYVEDFCLNRFRDNAAIGRQGFELVLNRLFSDNRGLAVL